MRSDRIGTTYSPERLDNDSPGKNRLYYIFIFQIFWKSRANKFRFNLKVKLSN